jgi:hypothetical protein
MHEEQASVTTVRGYRDRFAKGTRVENANLSIMHESISLHEFEQMGFDVCANGAVRFDYRAGFGIRFVPGLTDL